MNSKTICFISPKSCFFFKKEEYNKILKNLPGFDVHERYWSGLSPALPILAALTNKEYNVEIIDENIEEIDFNKKYDLIAVTSMTHQAIRAYQICSEFKKRKITTILGGIHPSYLPDEALKYSDCVVVGEAENIWPHLLNDFKHDKLKNIYKSSDFESVKLDDIPIPRYDLLKNKNYKILWLNTSRGCPYDCEFCIASSYFGKKHRHKKINQIINEIKFIKKHFERILIGFGDNNMFLNKNFTKKLLPHFIDLNFNWICQSDISIGGDQELLRQLFQAGCRTVFIGFESLDKINLEQIYSGNTKKLKSDNLEHYKEMIYNIQSNGIGIWGSFVVGFDNDTKDVFDKITNFINKNYMLGAHITILTPLPGTRVRKKLLSENRILPTSWDNYTFADLNFIPKKMTEQEIETGLVNAFKNIFTNKNRNDKILYFKEIMKKIKY